MSRGRSYGSGGDIVFLAVAAVVLIAFFSAMNFVCASFASDERAVQAAENIGLRDVQVVSKGPSWGVWGGCKESDVAKFKLRGTDGYGTARTIEVCAPVPFGGYTIRN